MAVIYPNIELTGWNSVNEKFNNTTLDKNWEHLDNHNHTGAPYGKQIPTEGLEEEAVTTAKLGSEAVVASKITNATITGSKIANSTITGAKIASETITSAQLGQYCVGISSLAPECVVNSKLASGSVKEAQIFAEAVTGPKLGLGTVRQKTGTQQSFISWGWVTEGGTIEAGTEDYTINHVETGVFKINWSTAKESAYYAVVATPTGIDTTSRTLNQEKSSVELVFEYGGTKANTNFSFIAAALNLQEI